MGDRLSALLMSLMALRLGVVDRNPFRPVVSCFILPVLQVISQYKPKVSHFL